MSGENIQIETQNAPENIVDPQRTFEVKEQIKIDDGMHNGSIVRVEYRDSPYQYMDVILKIDGSDVELKAGFPQNVSTNSALGKLLERFGVALTSGEKVNPYTVLTSKKVTFQTISESTRLKDGKIVEFARVVRESIKPLTEEAK